MVLPRLLTALLGAPLLLWALLLGGFPWVVAVGLITFLGLWEFHTMAGAGGHETQGVWGLLISWLPWVGWGGAGMSSHQLFPAQISAAGLTLVVLGSLGREIFRRDNSLSVLRLAMTMTAVLVITWPLSHLGLLRELTREGDPFFGRSLLWGLFAILWTQDTVAWVVGSRWGRHRLAPVLSPHKSWEGSLAGLASGAAVGAWVWHSTCPTFLTSELRLGLAVGMGILGQFSDLSESLLKRCFGVKDSSALLPGHGGVLDRFDTFLLPAPVLYLVAVLAG